MQREELVLAAMAPGGGYRYAPVQVQKLFFLIDRQIPQLVDGPHFDFQPYHYGPFDRSVYDQLDELALQGLVTIDSTSSPRTFALTADGVERGNAFFAGLSEPARDFMGRASHFVRTQSFASLVSAIYKAFPEMRANSVFQS
jgi:uncharacterized protein